MPAPVMLTLILALILCVDPDVDPGCGLTGGHYAALDRSPFTLPEVLVEDAAAC